MVEQPNNEKLLEFASSFLNAEERFKLFEDLLDFTMKSLELSEFEALKEVAKISGVTIQAIYDYRKKKYPPGVEASSKMLSELLRVTPNEPIYGDMSNKIMNSVFETYILLLDQECQRKKIL